jgi:hypothetical protein
MEFRKSDADALRRFLSLFPRDADLTLVVLKGHLLIEEQIRRIIAERLKNQDALKNAKLETEQAIHIAHALIGEDNFPFWKTALKLNTLRNLLAHNLEPSGIEDRVKHIVAEWGHEDSAPDLKGQLEHALFDMALWAIHLVQKPSAEILHLVKPTAT